MNLELAGLIVSQDISDFTNIKEFQTQLKDTFNHEYNEKDIEDSLALLLGQQEELIVYPDDHIQGL